MAKKLSPKQKKIARFAKPRNKITGADFKKLKKRGKKKKLILYAKRLVKAVTTVLPRKARA